ncbi:MAG TPA: DNA polymerase III subunit delta' [Blastocatellia bacterium]|nr:DNA polymerase III subunit delta' [Blastocatellia bacterium]
MPFAALIGNERIKKLLQRAVSEARIGQSLLMAGPRGVGKYQFALALAQALNCEQPASGDACGQCIPCRKIARNEHADVRTILRESQDPLIKKESRSQFIKIEQTRLMSEQAQFRPYEGRRRVFILDDAEWLRREAANSLLKTLEEPPETSLIILITPKPFALIDTIRSRCLLLSFAPLTTSEIELHLLGLKKTPDEARLRARLSGGSIGRAIEIDLDEYREMRNILLELLESLAFSRSSASLMGAAEYLGRKIEKDEFERHLEALTVLLGDLLRLKLREGEGSLTNEDVIERLQRIAGTVSEESIIRLADGIEDVFRDLPRNINRQLAMEAILIQA